MARIAPHNDAFGQLLWDFHRGVSAEEIVEREDGWIGAAGGPGQYFQRYADWQNHEKKATRYVRGKVLDIGCGAGRHALYLQEKGFDVLGIDTSPLAVQVSKERGLKKTRVMSATQISSRLGRFDTLLMMGSNFGLFGNLKRARWLLRRFRNLTAANGRIIAESTDPYDTTRTCHLDYQRWNRKRGKFSCQLKIRIRYQTCRTPWFEYLKVSRDEMKTILEGTGWQVAQFIPETGSTYAAIIEKR